MKKTIAAVLLSVLVLWPVMPVFAAKAVGLLENGSCLMTQMETKKTGLSSLMTEKLSAFHQMAGVCQGNIPSLILKSALRTALTVKPSPWLLNSHLTRKNYLRILNEPAKRLNIKR